MKIIWNLHFRSLSGNVGVLSQKLWIQPDDNRVEPDHFTMP
jgi:hypothetical protein